MSERIAGHNLGDESLHTIAVFGDGCNQLIHHDFVVTFKLAAQGIGQQFLRHVTGKVVRSRGDDGFQLFGRSEVFSTGKFARGINRPSGIILVAPPPDGVKILQAKADGIKDLVAIGASGILDVQFRALA